MGYILSMEYGRMWQKEKEDWYSLIFQPHWKQADLRRRRRKLRQEFLEAKRQAEIKIQERKERLAREAEEKAKAEAEAQEKAKRIKAKLEKCAVKKKPKKSKKEEEKEQETRKAETEPEKKGNCPKGFTPIEITLQCPCTANGAQEGGKEEAHTEQSNVDQKQIPEQMKKIEESPCGIDCMPNQIKTAVDRLQQKDAAEECGGCDTPDGILPDDKKLIVWRQIFTRF